MATGGEGEDDERRPQDGGTDDDDDGAAGWVAETLRKAFSQGFRSVRASEEKLRGMVGDAMPRELVTYLKGAVDKGRDELVRAIGGQTRRFLEGLDVGTEVAKILTMVSFEIRTEIRFIPNDQKLKPSIRTSIRPKRAGGDEADAGPDEG
jgi:hypothetical protein